MKLGWILAGHLIPMAGRCFVVDPAADFALWPSALACTYGPYRAIVRSVTDGDTLKALVDVGLRTWVLATIRLYGIDAPERNAEGGPAATHFLSTVLPPGTKVRVTTFGYDSFGRWLSRVDYIAADIASVVRSVSEVLLEQGHAVLRRAH